MPLSSSVSLKVIAKELGISNTAVSMALRHRPGVSDELRKQVFACAERLGYAPNPVASELMTIVRSQRPSNPDSHLIAYVNTFATPSLYLQSPSYRKFDQGATNRAKDYGYHVEVFNAFGNGMNSSRLSQILKARGVRGLLVGPRCLDEPDLDLDWSAFSTVLVGSEKYGAGVYRVCNNHVHSCATTLHRLEKLGYRHIGVVLLKRYEATRGFDYLLGVEQFRNERGGAIKIEVILPREKNHAEVVAWAKKHRLDALVSLESDVWEAVKMLREDTGRPVGFACLSVIDGAPYTGIDQHYDEVGAVSVELLRSLLLNGARGVMARPQITLVEGEWVAGSTAPAVV